MSETAARGHLLDTSALIGLAHSRQISALIVTAPLLDVPLYAPAVCVDAADRVHPGTARHVGRIPAIEPLDLSYAAVLDGRERTPDLPLPVAHVVHLARPGWLDLIVTTAEPELYREFDLDIYPVKN